ncbi:MAG: hypothetical protein WDO18_21450 [Acidobacteriota bacterium]
MIATRRTAFAAMATLGLILAAGYAPVAQSQTASVAARPEQASAQMNAMVQRYCVGCHNAKVASGGLRLDQADFQNVASWSRNMGACNSQIARRDNAAAGDAASRSQERRRVRNVARNFD